MIKHLILFLTVLAYWFALIATFSLPSQGQVHIKGFIKEIPYFVIDDGVKSGIILGDNETYNRIDIGEIYDVKCMCSVGNP